MNYIAGKATSAAVDGLATGATWPADQLASAKSAAGREIFALIRRIKRKATTVATRTAKSLLWPLLQIGCVFISCLLVSTLLYALMYWASVPTLRIERPLRFLYTDSTAATAVVPLLDLDGTGSLAPRQGYQFHVDLTLEAAASTVTGDSSLFGGWGGGSRTPLTLLLELISDTSAGSPDALTVTGASKATPGVPDSVLSRCVRPVALPARSAPLRLSTSLIGLPWRVVRGVLWGSRSDDAPDAALAYAFSATCFTGFKQSNSQPAVALRAILTAPAGTTASAYATSGRLTITARLSTWQWWLVRWRWTAATTFIFSTAAALTVCLLTAVAVARYRLGYGIGVGLPFSLGLSADEAPRERRKGSRSPPPRSRVVARHAGQSGNSHLATARQHAGDPDRPRQPQLEELSTGLRSRPAASSGPRQSSTTGTSSGKASEEALFGGDKANELAPWNGRSPLAPGSPSAAGNAERAAEAVLGAMR